ncbi:hypothetical protein niasHT_025052 [Heterodera trifolii]|uniref:Uncharacterized protein n=1 Tax=Heterodera trifolii TaxID=157864 RepID=A0ABD2KL77_9BILA
MGLKLIMLTVPFSALPEKSYKLPLGQLRKRQHQQKKGRQKESRICQKPPRPSSVIASPMPSAPISAFAPPPPITSSASPPPPVGFVFDRGGGGQWESPPPVTDDHRRHHQIEQMAKLATVGTDDNTPTGSGEEHSVVHLISRPTQLYYFGGGGDGMDDRNKGPMRSADGLAAQRFASTSVQIGVGQVCRVKVPTADVFYISYEDDQRSGGGMGRRPFVDVFFHCSHNWSWCCGVDCCQLDPALVFTGACVLVVLCALSVHCCLRSEFGQRVCVRRLFRMHRRRHKRFIARANAQRRKSAVDGGAPPIGRGNGAIVRKPSTTVSSGEAEQLRHYEQQQQQQQKVHQRSSSDLRRMIRNSIRETIGRGHRRLVRTGHQLRGDRQKNGRSVPEIMVTEPSSSCYGAEDEQGEEEMEQYEDEC